ncbi:MAG: phosphoglycerate kinase [Gammaproteobacteria bacterium]|nr:phosphoglycerate kinase [Gammaproteobacteria bacterium]MYD80439.1 phosphoglycerate kinase [Gammaproteobacteria bacterium]
MNVHTLDGIDIAGKRVAIRVDLNVPLNGNEVANDERIRAILPTLTLCRKRGAEVVLLSHLGRPKGRPDARYSLQPVADYLAQLLNRPVAFVSNWRSTFLNTKPYDGVRPGSVAMLENVRFEKGEELNDPNLGGEFASIGEVYVMDAFGTAHRAHASTCAAIDFAKTACAGPLLLNEIDSIERAVSNPKRPLVAVIGGSKVSGKLQVLHRLADIADTILVGGGMANTFLLAHDLHVGNSLVEPDLVGEARSISSATNVPLPTDVMACKELASSSIATLRRIKEVQNDDIIADIGPITARKFASLIRDAGTVLWNGPMGVFEFDQFGEGTRVVSEAIADTRAETVAGGGDTIAAIDRNGLRGEIDYVSTGGGAFLHLIEGKELPALGALKNHAARIQATS